MEEAKTGFMSEKEEDHPSNWDTAKDILIDWMKRTFDMPAREFMALSAIHSAGIASGTLGTKYDWFGYGYLGNMYFKMIANHPTYEFNKGGDLSFMIYLGFSLSLLIGLELTAAGKSANKQASAKWQLTVWNS